jgi:nitrogen-specific signal transduction histidine kinase
MSTGAKLADVNATTLTRVEALDSLRTGVVVVDAHECVREMNPAAEQLLGVGRRVAAGRMLADVFPHAQPLLDLVRRALRTGGGFAHRALMLRPGDNAGKLHAST